MARMPVLNPIIDRRTMHFFDIGVLPGRAWSQVGILYLILLMQTLDLVF